MDMTVGTIYSGFADPSIDGMIKGARNIRKKLGDNPLFHDGKVFSVYFSGGEARISILSPEMTFLSVWAFDDARSVFMDDYDSAGGLIDSVEFEKDSAERLWVTFHGINLRLCCTHLRISLKNLIHCYRENPEKI